VRFKASPVCGVAALFAASLQLTASSHKEVLVVYNTNSSDSLNVANHYMSQRSIPASNLCAITPPAIDLDLNDYTIYVKTPIQSCLNAVGKTSILYIVMSYMTPLGVGAGPMGFAAVDSYLADIWDKYASQPFLILPNVTQPYYADSQSQGNVYVPFQSFAQYRANARNPLIYSVWRLDAPTPALSMALVDQAISVENTGMPPVGQACIDEEYDPTPDADASYPSGNWDLYKASQFLNAAGLTVLTDQLGTTFGTPPSPTCPNTAFYSGWYNPHYNNAFTWQTGSIGWDLNSYAYWAPGALSAGVAVTTGAVAEPYLQGLVRPGGAFRNLLEGASVGDAFLRNTRWLKWEIAYYGDPLYKPFGTGLPPFSPLQPVNSFMISPQEIVGGTNTTGTITLSANAPTGGESFTLTGAPGITVPATVTVAGGATRGTFPITTSVVANSQFNVITAASASLTLQNTIITDPLLGAFVPSSTTTMAGFPISVTAILNGPAPTGGAVISLSSDNPVFTVPPTVRVPAGSMVATFIAGSTPVLSGVTANITGAYAGNMSTFSLTAVQGIGAMDASPFTINVGQQTVIEVYTGTYVPAGDTATIQITSSDPVSLPAPATITVPGGTHYGNFDTIAAPGSSGKTVTITATYAGSSASATVTIN
jgi:uncharacterized protein (TIGR03790 family)